MKNSNRTFSKIKFIYLAFFALTVFLIFSAFRWQILNAEEFQAIADSRVYSKELSSLRGSIYSRDGTTLATTVRTFDLNIFLNGLEYLEEKNIQTRDELLKKISKVINKTPEEIEKIIIDNQTQGRVWFPIATGLSDEQWNRLSNLKTDNFPDRKLGGFSFEYKTKRLYPEGTLAAHLIGLTQVIDNQKVGVSGLEGYWDGDLNPTSGFEIKESNVLGQSVASALFATTEPMEGSSLYTTIDVKLQRIVEDKLKESVEKYQAESGNIIVMDPKTSEILAFAKFPTYNPNLREETNFENYNNNALTSPYEMGSTGKVLTLATAIDLGLISLDEMVLPNGHNGCEKFEGENFRPGEDRICTWDRKPQGPMTAQECLTKSDNICFYHISQKIKNEDFYNYFLKFGVSRPTGVDLSNDDPGSLRSPEDWTLGDIATFSYGHGYQVTALQAINSVAAVANNGVRMKPQVVRKVVKGDGKEILQKPVVLDQVISKETADIIGRAMSIGYVNDIKDWEWYFQDLKNYDIGVKSGTALIADQTGYTSEINASYVGYDRSPDRKFVMLVRLEKPKVGALSFYNVRPMWLETFALIKDHLGVPRID